VVISNIIIKIYRLPESPDLKLKGRIIVSLSGIPRTERNAFIWHSADYHGVMDNITVIGIHGLPVIHEGDDITSLICKSHPLGDGDILCIASTIYSKSKGYTKPLASINPGKRAERLARLNGEDPRFVQAVLDASADIIMEHPFILSELPFGHIGVRAGVDQSNIEDGMIIFLPPDPMKAAESVRNEIKNICGKDVGVIITDTCGRSFRRGQTGNAIGWSGMTAIRDFRGDVDLFGHILKITEEAVVDEIAGFANFVMGESNNGVPAVIFRNCPRWSGHDNLYFSKAEDITRKMLKKEMIQ
jgi:coenzyme F420-0:L-glutamate ligase/coenzyme F420-1:gamma-L-glutamate ligase